MLGGIFHFYSNFNTTFCKQTVETLIRRCIVRRLIWVCTVCRCLIKRTLGLNGLSISIKYQNLICWPKKFGIFIKTFFYITQNDFSLIVYKYYINKSYLGFHMAKEIRDRYGPHHEISNVVCATSKGSDQPAHMHRLNRAFPSQLTIPGLLSY